MFMFDDILCIESKYYDVNNNCEIYEGEVNIYDLMRGKDEFTLSSSSGKDALITLNISTYDIGITLKENDKELGKKELTDLKFITKSDGSLFVSKVVDNENFEITIKSKA